MREREHESGGGAEGERGTSRLPTSTEPTKGGKRGGERELDPRTQKS